MKPTELHESHAREYKMWGVLSTGWSLTQCLAYGCTVPRRQLVRWERWKSYLCLSKHHFSKKY